MLIVQKVLCICAALSFLTLCETLYDAKLEKSEAFSLRKSKNAPISTKDWNNTLKFKRLIFDRGESLGKVWGGREGKWTKEKKEKRGNLLIILDMKIHPNSYTPSINYA